MDNLLLKSQRNELFREIEVSGFEPSDFEWRRWRSVHDESTVVERLIHKRSEGYFHFDFLNNEPWCRFSPGSKLTVEESYPGSWRLLIEEFRGWLENLRRETGQGDLWAVLASGDVFGSATVNDVPGENTAFKPTERSRLKGNLDEIRAFIQANYEINAEGLEEIDQKLEYLEHASQRLGRKDWLNVAFSVIANIVVGAALAPDAARNLLRVSGSLLNWVIGGSPLLPTILE